MLRLLDRPVDLAEQRRLRHQIINDPDLNRDDEKEEASPTSSAVVQASEKNAVILRVDGKMAESSATLKSLLVLFHVSKFENFLQKK